MANPSSSALASLATLIQESSLRSHITLEALIADNEVSEKGLLGLTCYLDTAWIVAGSTMKTPPKILSRARDSLKAWLSADGGTFSAEMSATLCGGLQAADSIWRKAPGTLLLDAMITLRSSLESPADTNPHAS